MDWTSWPASRFRGCRVFILDWYLSAQTMHQKCASHCGWRTEIQNMYRLFQFCLISFGAVAGVCAATNSDFYAVQDFGAHGDGTNDDTAAFQKALDTAGQAGGGVVYASRGNY